MAQVHRRRLAVIVISVLAVGVLAPPAHADPPANDRLRNAIEIPSIPYTNTQDTTDAQSDGPHFCSNNGSVFYSFTATETRRLQADTIGSEYDTVLGVFTGELNAFEPVACNDDRFGLDSAVRFRAEAGTTYNLMIGFCCGNGADFSDGGTLVLNLDRARRDADLQVQLQVDDGAALNPDGSAVVSGTADCTARAALEVFGTLRQRQGDVIVRGTEGGSFICDPSATTEWELTIEPRRDAMYVGGEATFRHGFFADSWNQSIFVRNRIATVELAAV
jgi:hypothetical protein